MISKLAAVAAFLTVLTIVSAQDPTESSPINTDRPERSEAEEVIDSLVVSGRADIRAVIAELRRKLDRRLVDFFPELKEKIEKLHGDIDACYDQTVAHNVTVNIFEAKVHDIVKKFFESHGHLLENLDREKIHQRVKAFLGNVARLVELLFDCVVDRQKGRPTNRLGLTPLSVYSREEFENQILNKRLMQDYKNQATLGASGGNEEDDCSPDSWAKEPLPAKFNWNELGKVTRVYQQQSCGSCYVYSTTSAMESQYLIKANKTVRPQHAMGFGPVDNNQEEDVEFSVQATLNCMSNGCGGGSLQEPLEYYVNRGVTAYKNAPYKNTALQCRTDYPIALRARRFCYFTNSEEERIQRLLMRHGPAGVAIDASSPVLSFLKDSPFSGECGRALDHAVLMVGWDEKYWIIKNSWGPNWGIGGYLYLPRGDNRCGIQMMYGVPIVDPIAA